MDVPVIYMMLFVFTQALAQASQACIAGMQVIAFGLAIRSLFAWFKRHELDASKVSERFFESPHAVQKVSFFLAYRRAHFAMAFSINSMRCPFLQFGKSYRMLSLLDADTCSFSI